MSVSYIDEPVLVDVDDTIPISFKTAMSGFIPFVHSLVFRSSHVNYQVASWRQTTAGLLRPAYKKSKEQNYASSLQLKINTEL